MWRRALRGWRFGSDVKNFEPHREWERNPMIMEERVEEVPFHLKPYDKFQGVLLQRACRRAFLNKAVLNQNKDVVFARLRNLEDSVVGLMKQGLCPGVVLRHEGRKEEEIDVVLEGKAFKTRSRHLNFPNQTVYVRVEGKEYRCVLRKIDFHGEGFITKVFFKEYIPGKPNELVIPLQPLYFMLNQTLIDGFEYEVVHQTIPVVCYNEQYPQMLYYDVRQVNLDRSFRAGDLANTFPPGLILDPRFDPNLTIFRFNPERMRAHEEEDEKEEQEQDMKAMNMLQNKGEIAPAKIVIEKNRKEEIEAYQKEMGTMTGEQKNIYCTVDHFKIPQDFDETIQHQIFNEIEKALGKKELTIAEFSRLYIEKEAQVLEQNRLFAQHLAENPISNEVAPVEEKSAVKKPRKK